MKHQRLLSSLTVAVLIGSSVLAYSTDYEVRSGDTLWKIATRHKVSVAEIQHVNSLSGNTIEIGQVLTIPSRTEKKKIQKSSVKLKKPRYKTHIVSKGETLWAISKRHGVTVNDLKRRNHLKSETIEIGDLLVVSGSNSAEPRVDKVVKQQIRPELQNVSSAKDKKRISNNSKNEGMGEKKKEVKVATKQKTLSKEVELDQPEQVKSFNPMTPLPVIPEHILQGFNDQKVAKEKEEEKIAHVKNGLAALSEKRRGIVRQQIILDRNGMGPGIIDGFEGDFTKTATILAERNRPNLLLGETLVREVSIPEAILHYVNPTLPGTGKRPDFKKATEEQCLMMYKSSQELLAERYHCSEDLLAKMNPEIDFAALEVGQPILVPNVSEFKIEDFMTPEGQAVTYQYLRKTRRATSVDVDYLNSRIIVRHGDEMLASFPVTTNLEKGPKSERSIAYFAPAPTYMRKKTGLKLKAGPNSPVGIVWAKLGDGFGIHGTSDGSGNGYNTSAGCIRLSNWDMAIFVKIVPAKIKVNFITEQSSARLITQIK